MPKLELTLPDGAQMSHELMDDFITVGRLSDNAIQIEDASVSSHHAELSLDGKHYRLKDLDSTNGTRVNGESVTETLLKNSDIVRFGQIEGIYLTDAPAPTRPLPEQGAAPVAVATSSARPQGFANASPFKTTKKKKNPTAVAILSFAGVAVVAFAVAVASVLMLHPPQ